jgi:hypothetical protein
VRNRSATWSTVAAAFACVCVASCWCELVLRNDLKVARLSTNFVAAHSCTSYCIAEVGVMNMLDHAVTGYCGLEECKL